MAGAARKRTTRVQMVFQDPFASLDPRMRVGQTIAEGPLAHGLVEPRRRAQPMSRNWLDAVGLDPDFAEPLSAPVLRRPAPAHRHRARARHAARRAGLRRAGGLARRVDPGADHQSVPQAAPRARPHHAVHQPRSRRGAPRLGPRRHHVSRPHRRDRRRAAMLYASPLHPYTRALLDSVPKLVLADGEIVSFKAIQRRVALRAVAAERLPFSFALPACRGPLPQRDSAAARDRGGSPRRVPSRAACLMGAGNRGCGEETFVSES